MARFRWIKQEILHVIPVFLYFSIFFTLINWIETFLFEANGISPFRFYEVLIAAALIAKIVLVVDHLPWINRFKNRPLIFSISWKTSIYWALLFFTRLLIRFIPFLFGGTFEMDFHRFITQVNWNVFISIQAFYLLLLFIFVSFQELTVRIGSEKMRRLFFG